MTEAPADYLHKTVRWPQVLAGLAAAVGLLQFGVAIGWSSAGGKLIAGVDRYSPVSDEEFAWVASIFTIGCAFSCLGIGFFLKKFGRKSTMIASSIPCIAGWACLAWARNLEMLLLGRWILGLFGGGFCIAAPLYSAEICQKEIRGTVGMLSAILLNVGILIAYLLGAYLSLFWQNVVSAIFPLIFVPILVFIPESPQFLVLEKRDAEAASALKWLRGANYEPQWEIHEMKRDINDTPVKVIEMLKSKADRRAFAIGFGLMFFQQASAINAVLFYTSFIFTATQVDIDSNFQTIIVGIVLLLAVVLGGVLIDRVGRKIPLLISSMFITISLTGLGVYFHLADNTSVSIDNLTWLPMTLICVFLVTYSIGIGPLPWIILIEVSSKENLVIASPVVGFFSWMLAFVVTWLFGNVFGGGTSSTFFTFAGLSFLGIFFVHFVVVETKAKSMAEIQKVLAGEK